MVKKKEKRGKRIEERGKKCMELRPQLRYMVNTCRYIHTHIHSQAEINIHTHTSAHACRHGQTHRTKHRITSHDAPSHHSTTSYITFLLLTSGSVSAHLSNTSSTYSLESEHRTTLAFLAAFRPRTPIPKM